MECVMPHVITISHTGNVSEKTRTEIYRKLFNEVKKIDNLRIKTFKDLDILFIKCEDSIGQEIVSVEIIHIHLVPDSDLAKTVKVVLQILSSFFPHASFTCYIPPTAYAVISCK